MRKMLLAGSAAILLSGCVAYQSTNGDNSMWAEKAAARGCLVETTLEDPLPLGFGLIGGLASYPSQRQLMDACMARHGWTRSG